MDENSTSESPEEVAARKSRERMIDRLAEFSLMGVRAATESMEEDAVLLNRDAARKFLDREIIPWLMGIGSATEADARVAMYQSVAAARLDIIRDMGQTIRRFKKQTADLRRRLMRLSPPLVKRVLLKWRDWEVGIQMKAEIDSQGWKIAMSRIHLIDSIMKDSELPKKEPKT